MNKNRNRLIAALYALILPQRLYLLPPDEGGGDKDSINPALAALFGTADAQEEPPVESTRGMTLHEAIAEPSAEEKAEAEKKAAEEKAAADKLAAEKAAAEKKAEDDKAAAAATADRPLKATKRKSQAEVDAEARAKAEEADKAKKANEAQDWEKTLIDEERDQLEMARFAEQKFGEKYKGLGAKTEKFIRENAAKVEADDFDPESDEYREWVEKNRPSLSTAEIRMIERKRGEEIAEAKTRKSSDDVLDRTFRMIEEPRVKSEADNYYAKASSEVMPEEVKAVFKESAEKAREQFPFEYEIIEQELARHADAVEEMLALTRVNPDTKRVLRPYDPANPNHVAAFNIVQSVDESFKKTGGADLNRGGRLFLPRAELARIPVAERGKYWTFTSKEIADRSTAIVKERIVSRIKNEQERLGKMGFERKKATPAAAATPAAGTPPAIRPAPINSGGGGGGGTMSASERLMADAGMIASSR